MRKSSGFDNRMINWSKAKNKSSMTRASGSSSNQTITGRKLEGIGELIARQRASSFISKTVKPCCPIVMCPSSVHGSFLVRFLETIALRDHNFFFIFHVDMIQEKSNKHTSCHIYLVLKFFFLSHLFSVVSLSASAYKICQQTSEKALQSHQPSS